MNTTRVPKLEFLLLLFFFFLLPAYIVIYATNGNIFQAMKFHVTIDIMAHVHLASSYKF
ncbi:hypothetical protein PGB90_000754 [Kerria lacca]